MTAIQAYELCRIVLVTPHASMEMALPATVALCDMLPTLVQHASTHRAANDPTGAAAATAAGADEWVLQRLGGEPLTGEFTPAALGIRDGDVLYLRPREETMPPVHFDDLIDGLTTGVRRRADRWRGWMTRRLFQAAAGAALLLGMGLLLTGPPRTAAVLALAVTGVLLAAGGICSRAFGDPTAGLLFGCAAVPPAALVGLLAPTLPGRFGFAGPNVLCGAVAAGVAALFTGGLVGRARAMFLAVVSGCAVTAFGAGLTVCTGVDAAGAAAVTVPLTLLVATLAPNLAFKLSRLRLPMLPHGPEDLSEDIEPHRTAAVLAAARTADQYVTWLFGAVGGISAGGLGILVRTGRPATLGLAGAICAVLLLRARALPSAWQRIGTVLPAATGLAMLSWHAAGRADPADWVAWTGGTVLAAAAAIVLANHLPGKRLLPYWGRLADIAEYLAAIAALPLAAQVLHLVGWARALAG